VAETLGVRPETVANWERGLGRPLARHHGAIIRFLGFDPGPSGSTLPERLKATRLRLGLTQQAMAEKLGLDEGSVCRWESGSRRPSRWMAARLGGLLDALDQTLRPHRTS
jgi:transcriptional regulator with XRE-family HTH domain